MKRIGIYFFCVIALGCVTSSILYRRNEEANKIRLEKFASEASEESVSEKEDGFEEISNFGVPDDAIEVSDGNTSHERFLIKEEGGYLVIYDRVTMKRYDETTIQLYDLPEHLQELVLDGLYFTDEEALYAFLENYSS